MFSYNPQNPFIIATNLIESKKKINNNESERIEGSIFNNKPLNSQKSNISSESESIVNEENISQKKRHKEKNDPLYYYYIIDDKEYKYTCKKKTMKFSLPFNCSDTSCPAKGRYNKLTEIFTPENINHIPYENHSYVIPNLIKEKYNSDTFVESDFTNTINLKINPP